MLENPSDTDMMRFAHMPAAALAAWTSHMAKIRGLTLEETLQLPDEDVRYTIFFTNSADPARNEVGYAAKQEPFKFLHQPVWGETAKHTNFIDLGEEGDTLSGDYPVTVLRASAVTLFTDVFFRNDQKGLASLLGIKVTEMQHVRGTL
mgnify:CR=1 FL=1